MKLSLLSDLRDLLGLSSVNLPIVIVDYVWLVKDKDDDVLENFGDRLSEQIIFAVEEHEQAVHILVGGSRRPLRQLLKKFGDVFESDTFVGGI